MSKNLLSSKSSISTKVVDVFWNLTRHSASFISIAVLCLFQLHRKQKAGDGSAFPRASTALLDSSLPTSSTKQNQSVKLLSRPSPGQNTSTSEGAHSDSQVDGDRKQSNPPSLSQCSRRFYLQIRHIKWAAVSKTFFWSLLVAVVSKLANACC